MDPDPTHRITIFNEKFFFSNTTLLIKKSSHKGKRNAIGDQNEELKICQNYNFQFVNLIPKPKNRSDPDP